MHAIMAPDHELAGRRTVTLDECAGYRLIFHDDSGSMRAFPGEDMQAFKHSQHPAFTSNTIGFAKALLAGGRGLRSTPVSGSSKSSPPENSWRSRSGAGR